MNWNEFWKCNSPFVFCKNVRMHPSCDKHFLGDSCSEGIQKLRVIEALQSKIKSSVINDIIEEE